MMTNKKVPNEETVEELLFFDTFDHEGNDVLNLDLVQFQSPVFVTEIRVIPLGARVTADLPGGFRLGATHPSQFHLEFFVNDLLEPGACTFVPLGNLEYKQNGSINIVCETKIPTDGLILRGWYRTITLAVYGVLTQVSPDQPSLSQTSGNGIQQERVKRTPSEEGYEKVQIQGGKEEKDHEWMKDNKGRRDSRDRDQKQIKDNEKRDSRSRDTSRERERDRRERERRESRDRGSRERYRDTSERHGGRHSRTHTPEKDRSSSRRSSTEQKDKIRSSSAEDDVSSSGKKKDEAEAISEEETEAMPTEEEDTGFPSETLEESGEQEPEDYEEINSDDEGLGHPGEFDYEITDQEWDEHFKTFNPYSVEMQPLVHLNDPALTEFEIETRKLIKNETEEMNEEANKLLELTQEHTYPEATDKWVEAVEKVIPSLPTSLAFLLHKRQSAEVVEILVRWALLGLNFDEAFEQAQPNFKVRHLKAGIRLAGSLCLCSDAVGKQLLAYGIQHTLISLYHRDYMALSIRLMIIRSLDATVRSKLGMELCHGKKSIKSLQEELEVQVSVDETESIYQRLVKMIADDTPTRARVALEALVKRLNTYENLNNYSLRVASLVKDASSVDLDEIASLLQTVCRVYTHAKHLISQPPRALPLSVQFQLPTPTYDPYPPLFCLLQYSGLLESFVLLLSHPSSKTHHGVVSSVVAFLSELLRSQRGLLYLAAQPDTTNLLCKVLLQDGSDGGADDVVGTSSQNQLGLHMTYLVQGMLMIDRLLDSVTQNKAIDDPGMLEAMTTLYSMIFSPGGKLVVVWLLSQESNLDALLPLLDWKSQPNLRSQLKKSACAGYATDLILLVVKYTDNIPFLERYGKRLLQIVELDEKSKLGELKPWLMPAQEPSHFNVDGLLVVCDLVKKHSEDVLKFPGELITGLRMLRHLGVSPNGDELAEPDRDSELPVEVRFKYCIVQMFSSDMLPVFIGILEKLSGMYEQPYVRSSTLVSQRGALVVAIVKPIVMIVRRILSILIKCRGTDFRDMTAVPSLLRIYTLMCAFPSSAVCYLIAGEIQNELIDTLLSYTEPVTRTLESDQQLEKSPWTQMMATVLDYAISLPQNFMSGLQILTELLPLPLPVYSSRPLEEAEILQTVNARKLWSAHLHSLGSNIQQLVATLGVSSYPPLLQLLQRVCNQLSDLAAPTSHLVTRAILDAVIGSLKGDARTTAPTHLLSFFASMLNVPSVRAACLQILRGESKLDEKYSDVLDTLCTLLSKPSDSDPSQCWQIQEAVIAVLGALCDGEVSLLAGGTAIDSSDVTENPDITATIMPSREQLAQIVDALVEHIGNKNNGFASMLQSLRVLVVLTDTDYGFYHLVSSLKRKSARLLSIFCKLVNELNPSSSDCLSTLGTVLELVKLLLNIEDPGENTLLPPRVNTLGPADVRRILDWDMTREASEKKFHPIKELHEILQQHCKEEESLENMLETCTNFIQNLEQPVSESDSKELAEPAAGVPESLSSQFSQRAVYLVMGSDTDEDRLSSAYWLTNPPLDDDVDDTDQVMVDMLEIARTYLPDLDLAAELERVKGDNSDNVAEEPEEARVTKRKAKPQAGTPKQRITAKKPFVTAMRGRAALGGQGGGASGGGNSSRGDHFRSRAPNTSRAPSMHVDDFVALESTGHQPTGPTGYNPKSKQALKELHLKRARGRRGSDRGRYCGSFGRREGSRGSSRAGGGSRSSWGGSRGGGGGGGGGTPAARRNRGGAWGPRNKDRFGGTPPTRGRRDQRHQRAFTR